MKTREELLNERLDELHGEYDKDERLIGEERENPLAAYHSKITGRVHGTNKSAEYAAAILYAGQTRYYKRAADVFLRLAELQDTDRDSETFGLWAYFAEEDLGKMEAPDYNFADFIGKHFIYALSNHRDAFDDKTARIMENAVRNAALCSVKRNVSPDYTNISMMSCMTITAAGELLNDGELAERGAERLKKAYEYNKASGAFSEYNSSAYTPLAVAEITRMLMFFKDKELLRMAEELHDIAWENLSVYYSDTIGELAPPQKRCYRDLDNGELASFIYLATGGRFGSAERAREMSAAFLMLPIKCPEKFIKNFERRGSLFINKRYYRQNNIRTPDEDTVIIRSLKSPDLWARTYITDNFAAGSFDKSDLWAQRRNCSVVWNSGGAHGSFRLRCISGGHDCCSGVAAAAQKNGVIIGCAGFVNDHGDRHYILDKQKDGRIKTNYLAFVFELTGGAENTVITKENGGYAVRGGGMEIRLAVKEWTVGENAGEIRLSGRRIEFIVYEGGETVLDLNALKTCVLAFAMSVNEDLPELEAEKTPDGRYRLYDAGDKAFCACMPVDKIRGFDEFMSADGTEYAERNDN